MASNQLSTQGALPQMRALSPNTFLYEPPSAAPDPGSPQLIAIFAWMSAQDVHIAKYTSRYMALYPTARILLVKCPFIHTLSVRIARREIKPAVSVVRALADATPPGEAKRPQLLLHVFSNGGASNLSKFFDLYAAADRAGRGLDSLPPHVSVYDSCPGGFHWMRSYRALSAVFPRFLAPLVHVFIGWFWIFQVPFGGRHGFLGRMWAALKQKALLQSEQRRVYLYSREDEMIYWGDVEKHANEAREVGFRVGRERFEGSQHVAHARTDGERYWGAVRELWDGRRDSGVVMEREVKTEAPKVEETKAKVVEPDFEVVEKEAVKEPVKPEVEVKPDVVKAPEPAKIEVLQPTPVKPEVNQNETVRKIELAEESDLVKQPEVVTEAEIKEAEVAKMPEPVKVEPPRRKKQPTPPPTIQ
ncbi:unnamed protein product [Colletotrichum noveboracense]|uniref:Indole-diterpene biosynthesis protein PaxU n=1 Tax=Colletotrichum noveboracense TaxID=2664923 RepID=A0A9W4RZI1_9PEZI|nr:hypothetical protein COL940_002010 [Colletotrichum noveboracense]KAJ0294568.1 hypothetical protein CBS470a_000475 [Colletotrichum nupharicola]KAJ0322713.1 hypothetical protein Brms1b_002094 [Colletotrichum noveboracense]CAI0650141.1 unnamed protein product [Colletotrichum noveboracense]